MNSFIKMAFVAAIVFAATVAVPQTAEAQSTPTVSAQNGEVTFSTSSLETWAKEHILATILGVGFIVLALVMFFADMGTSGSKEAGKPYIMMVVMVVLALGTYHFGVDRAPPDSVNDSGNSSSASASVTQTQSVGAPIPVPVNFPANAKAAVPNAMTGNSLVLPDPNTFGAGWKWIASNDAGATWYEVQNLKVDVVNQEKPEDIRLNLMDTQGKNCVDPITPIP